MSAGENKLEEERSLINTAKGKGPISVLGAYVKLSGPGWLQSAITLGGGSLGGSMYLGVLVGFGMMWLQPLAMIMGVVMLSAIAYVTLSTGERPFGAINKHINPVLGWAWLIATLLANMVWAMPQFSLGTGAVTQNLFPALQGNTELVVAALFLLGTAITWQYNSGSKGVKFFELLLKILVGIVVISFFGVVIRLAFSEAGLPWGEILSGFIPSTDMNSISPKLASSVAATGAYADFWSNQVSDPQVKTMLTAAATAVGINMTFLLPYSMLRRSWDRDFRGLAIFDLSTGLVVPYILATSCVVIASASQFHAQPAPGFLGEKDNEGNLVAPAVNLVGGVNGLLDGRLKAEFGKEEFATKFGSPDDRSDEQTAALAAARTALPESDIRMAAILVKRDNQQLASALEGLTGKTVAHVVFGIGVLAMAISTIVILMLINGFALCEALGHDPKSNTFRAGCILAGLSGALGSLYLWGNKEAAAWLVVPTSMFGFALLPIAYVTFFFMMNSKSLLGDNMPSGINRLKWNVLMTIATGLAIIGSFVSIQKSNTPNIGFAVVGTIIVAAVVAHFMKKSDTDVTPAESESSQA